MYHRTTVTVGVLYLRNMYFATLLARCSIAVTRICHELFAAVRVYIFDIPIPKNRGMSVNMCMRDIFADSCDVRLHM